MEKKPFDYGSAIGETPNAIWAQTGAPFIRGYQEHLSKDKFTTTYYKTIDNTIDKLKGIFKKQPRG